MRECEHLSDWSRALRSISACVLLAAALIVAIAPRHAHAQVFNDVIESIFNGTPNNCQDAFGISPDDNSSLALRCADGGPGAAAAPSGGSAAALANESSPAKERLFEQEIGHLNVFISADYEHFQKQTTKYEPSYKDSIWRGAIGADYLMGTTTLGGAIRYVRNDGKFGGTTDPKFRTNSYGVVLYANAAPSESSFVSGSIGYMRQDFDIERAVFLNPTGTPPDFLGTNRGTPKGDEFEASINGGYDFRFDSVTIGPVLGANYLYDLVDDYSEHGDTGLELAYSNIERQSLTSRVGAHGSIAISTSFGVIVPQVRGEYVHEFFDRQRKTDFRFVEDQNRVRFSFENDDPDRDYFEVGAGVVLQLADGIAPFVSFRTLLGYNAYSSREVTAGARFEF